MNTSTTIFLVPIAVYLVSYNLYEHHITCVAHRGIARVLPQCAAYYAQQGTRACSFGWKLVVGSLVNAGNTVYSYKRTL